MNERENCNFFLLRYVPDAVKSEFVNIGLVLLPHTGNPEFRFSRDLDRVKCLDPQADLELLESLESDLRSKLHEANGDRDFILRRIQDSFSNALQPSEFKACLAESPAKEADALARMYLEPARQGRTREVSGRQNVFNGMRRAFQIEGIWDPIPKNIPVSKYTGTRDPLEIDCGYSNGSFKMFHALGLSNDMSGVNSAKALAFSFPQLAEGILKKEGKPALLTAIVADGLEREEELIGFAMETLERQKIAIAPVARMPEIARQAAREIGLR